MELVRKSIPHPGIVMKKLIVICLAVGLSSLAFAQESLEKDLRPVPSERVFSNFSVKSGLIPLYIETDHATGECGMGLWVDEQLALVFYPQEKSVLYLSPGEHEFRVSYEPLPNEPRDDEEKKKFKYCKKNEPEKLGFLKKVEVKADVLNKMTIRSNKGYLYRIKVTEEEKDTANKN